MKHWQLASILIDALSTDKWYLRDGAVRTLSLYLDAKKIRVEVKGQPFDAIAMLKTAHKLGWLVVQADRTLCIPNRSFLPIKSLQHKKSHED